jgi:uncharacterized membrane protein required for colicin V production
MVMDIMVGIIFVGAIVLSMRKGFALIVINFIRVIASIVLGVLFCDDVKNWLLEKTGLNAWIEDTLQKQMADTLTSLWSETELYAMLPEILQKETLALTGSLAGEGAASLSGTFLSILSFFLIVLAIGLICSLLNRIFSKQYNGGFFGFMDWVLGAVMGALGGLFYVFVFLAIIVPITAFFMPSLSETLMTSLAESHIAGSLYDNNLLLLLFRDFFH